MVRPHDKIPSRPRPMISTNTTCKFLELFQWANSSVRSHNQRALHPGTVLWSRCKMATAGVVSYMKRVGLVGYAVRRLSLPRTQVALIGYSNKQYIVCFHMLCICHNSKQCLGTFESR